MELFSFNFMFFLPFSLSCLLKCCVPSHPCRYQLFCGGIYFAPLPNLFFPMFPFITICLSIARMFLNVSFSHLPPQVPFHSIFTSLTKSPASRQCVSSPIYFFPFAPSVCVYVIEALQLVKVISSCADPVTTLKIRNLFSYATVYLLITLWEATREFL